MSSGVDSSYVVREVSKVAKDVKTFSVGYEEEKYSELPYAQDFSKTIGVQNISNKVSADEFFEANQAIQYYMDEPLPNPSEVPLFFLAQNARKYVKVVLFRRRGRTSSLAGTRCTLRGMHFEKYRKNPARVAPGGGVPLRKRCRTLRARTFIVRGGMEPYQRFMRSNFVFTYGDVNRYLKKDYHQKDPCGLCKALF